MRVGCDGFLVRRTLERLNRGRGHATCEERIADEFRSLGVYEHGGFTRQGGGKLPRTVLFHRGDQARIHILIANAVCQPVDAVLHQLLRVRQVKDVGGNRQMALVGSVDDGLGYLVRHLLLGSQMVVHPELDDIDALFRLSVDRRVRFRRGGDSGSDALQAAVPALEYESLPGSVDSRDRRPAGALLFANLENQILIGAQAQHCGYAV